MIIEIAITKYPLYQTYMVCSNMFHLSRPDYCWESHLLDQFQTHRVVLRQAINTPQFDAWNSTHLSQPTIIAVTYRGSLQWFMIHTACTRYMTTYCILLYIVESDIIAPVVFTRRTSCCANRPNTSSSSKKINCILWQCRSRKGIMITYTGVYRPCQWRLLIINDRSDSPQKGRTAYQNPHLAVSAPLQPLLKGPASWITNRKSSLVMALQRTQWGHQQATGVVNKTGRQLTSTITKASGVYNFDNKWQTNKYSYHKEQA